MKFWDTSALVETVLREHMTDEIRRLHAEDSDIVLWWATPVECLSPIMRRVRERALTPDEAGTARRALERIFADSSEIPASSEVRDAAAALIARHPLRAADALQLAAALEWAGNRPRGEGFVCLDNRLREAALLEGFTVLP